MPKLELEGDYSDRFLFNAKAGTQPESKDLTAQDQEDLVSHWASEIENDPSKLQQLASQVVREQKVQNNNFKTVQIQPIAGFVCKTKTTTALKGFPIGTKVFINICHAPEVPEPTPTATEKDIQKALRAEEGANYQVPMSLGATRYDFDHAEKACMVIDACIHTQPFLRAERDLDYRLYILELAMELVEERDKVQLSREFTMPNISSKGTIPPRMLQVPKSSLVTALPEQATPFTKAEMYMDKGHLVIAVKLSPAEAKTVTVHIQPECVIFTSKDQKKQTTRFPQPVDINHAKNTATYHQKSEHLVLRLQVA
ncbi:hypothetical protein K450DRAFT_298546 [Umbelopsis ramanniana AG]|uniref:PIH1 N-terminal domain-containing protein n=1 Tax=Umbelopsis ramanniana AG TaxID=1314678 RepID=A0AAD5EDM8_UMBRA|nr:uncharacterized protein K450DRAFT_298546 [Umbelopsis ramanniana AG]KAI8581482.1 hypothetical protein K450DRAFT_298546 [Umbelopsis ramanniana AG]